jgi:DNA-binding transcriptional regulator YiaG
MTMDLNDPNTIRDARRALGFTQSQLAHALELLGPYGKDTVRAWESGKRPISGPARAAIRLMLEKAEAANPDWRPIVRA